jgi:excisionase family DNA binding protein
MQPKFASIQDWLKISGLGRTTVYHLIAEGKLKAIKAGTRTLIDVEHGLVWLHALPPADIKCAREYKAA